MNVFDTHRQIVADYAQYIRSFINISDSEIASTVEASLSEGRLWPQPLLQFNPAYEQAGTDFVVTSGTGSGKSLTYIGTIFNHLLANPATAGVAAIIVYPMNALINSQSNEFNTYKDNYERNTGRTFPILFGQYTGQEKEDRRQAMREDPVWCNKAAEVGESAKQGRCEWLLPQ